VGGAHLLYGPGAPGRRLPESNIWGLMAEDIDGRGRVKRGD
jgi:hypothetical protein